MLIIRGRKKDMQEYAHTLDPLEWIKDVSSSYSYPEMTFQLVRDQETITYRRGKRVEELYIRRKTDWQMEFFHFIHLRNSKGTEQPLR